MSRPAPDPERVRREAYGRLSESVAAAYLVLHGYRILARRHRTPSGEIDIIAVRRRRIAFVEVKFRRSVEEGEAALRGRQANRVAHAAAYWIARHPVYAEYEQGFDAIIMRPWARPVLMRDAYQPIGTSGRM